MDDRPWWRWLLDRPRVWRWHRTDDYKRAMAGYWSGQVCRFCDRNLAERAWCDIPWPPGAGKRPCDFRIGKGRRRRD